MKTLILLDTGPLGLVTHPRGGQNAKAYQDWFQSVLDAGALVRVPAIADYELRRELIRASKEEHIGPFGENRATFRLDCLIAALGYLPLTRRALELASRFWALDRKAGYPTAPDPALDGDSILAAQARTAQGVFTSDELRRGIAILIATTNTKHLDRHANAGHWSEIGVEP